MEQQNLGELQTVPNTLRNHQFEGDELVVGWLIIDNDLRPIAFTPHELERPKQRAQANREDLPTLVAQPPSHGDLAAAREETEKLKDKLEKLRNRGILARIFNTGFSD